MDNEQSGTQAKTTPQTKADLVARIIGARRALDQVIGSLGESELEASGPDDGWSVKDHLAHLAAWEEGIAALLQRRPRWEAMGLDLETVLANDEAGINAMIERRNKARSLQAVLSAFGQAQHDLLDALEPLTDADLFKGYSHYQPDEPGRDNGAPIIGWIIGNTYAHYEEHQRYIEALIAQRAG
ncbi:MAG: ClbS/DfsB family four-helix bundle protein [Ardenticatenaceae bacterium]|nr:ClbS/DfsB family four-helix bundle protein [Ardenticatenaceae bacterium]